MSEKNKRFKVHPVIILKPSHSRVKVFATHALKRPLLGCMHSASRCAMACCFCIRSSSLSVLKVSSFIATSNGFRTVYRCDTISTRLNCTERNIMGPSRVRRQVKAKVKFFLPICLDNFVEIFRYPSADMWRHSIMSWQQHKV